MKTNHIIGQQDIPTVRFSPWLRHARRALVTGEGVNVSCGNCTACCTSFYFVHIKPEETRTLGRIPENLMFPAPGLPEGHMVLGYDEKGHCPMFSNDTCTIYDDRPLTCRNYDCRIFAATGLSIDSDSKMISRQAHRWNFDFSSRQDHEQFSAVQSAAKFIQEHENDFPNGFLPSNNTQRAVMAIKAYTVFLSLFKMYEGADYKDSNREIADAVMAACDEFENR